MQRLLFLFSYWFSWVLYKYHSLPSGLVWSFLFLLIFGHIFTILRSQREPYIPSSHFTRFKRMSFTPFLLLSAKLNFTAVYSPCLLVYFALESCHFCPQTPKSSNCLRVLSASIPFFLSRSDGDRQLFNISSLLVPNA